MGSGVMVYLPHVPKYSRALGRTREASAWKMYSCSVHYKIGLRKRQKDHFCGTCRDADSATDNETLIRMPEVFRLRRP